MIALIGVILLAVLLVPYFIKANKYEEIERQQSMRRAMYKVQEKHRRYSL